MQQWCKKYSWTIFIRSKKLEKLKYGHKYGPIEFQMAFLYIDSCVFTNYGPFSFQAKHGRICSKRALLKGFVCLFCKWSYWVKFPLTQRCRKRRRCKQMWKPFVPAVLFCAVLKIHALGPEQHSLQLVLVQLKNKCLNSRIMIIGVSQLILYGLKCKSKFCFWFGISNHKSGFS